MKKFKAILIDPFEQSIKETEIENTLGGLDAIYKVMDCRLVDIVSLGNNHDLFIDDEGRLKSNNRWFTIGGHAFAGKCLLLDHDVVNGQTISTSLSIDDVKVKIEFLDEDYHEEPFMNFIPL